MKIKQMIKILVDIGMTTALLMLMAYSLIGEAAHEWIGLSIFVLFILHHKMKIECSYRTTQIRYEHSI